MNASQRKAEIIASRGSSAFTVALHIADGDEWRAVCEVSFVGPDAYEQASRYVREFLQTGYW